MRRRKHFVVVRRRFGKTYQVPSDYMPSDLRVIAQQDGIVSMDLCRDQDAKRFIKTGSVTVAFAQEAGRIATREGEVGYLPGDALITGVEGECWPVARQKFDSSYVPIPPNRHGQPGEYRNTVVIWAKQMEKPFAVRVGAHGDVIHGKAGDWLTQYGPGALGVVAAEIFRKSYEPCL